MVTKFILLLYLVTTAVTPVLASEEDSSVLNALLPDGTIRRYTTFPAATVKLLFHQGNAIIEHREDSDQWPLVPAALLKKIQFVTVNDPQRRFFIAGVVFADQLFTFDQLFCSQNAAVMSQLIRATGTSPKSSDDALALAKLYLSLSYYRLKNPAQFVVSGLDELPAEKVSFPNESLNDIREVLRAPRIVSTQSGYEVELFARDLDITRIHRWRISISSGGVWSVSDKRVYPNYKEMHDLYSRAKDKTEPGEEEKIELWRCCFMANGYTGDGATTDLGVLAASNGPFVQRTHYYYHSNEKAKNLMQRFLKDAVEVINSGPWLDDEGKSAGEQATLILTGHDKALFAAQLFYHDDNLLEFQSPCLRNLQALTMRPPEGKGLSDSLVATLECPDRVKTVSFSPEGKLLAAGYGWRSEGGVRVWNVANRNVVLSWVSTKTEDDENDMIKRVAFSPNGKLLAAATWKGDLLLFDAKTWAPPRRIPLNAGEPSALTFSPDNELLAFSTAKTIIVYNMESAQAKTLMTSDGPVQRFIEAGFLPDGKTLVICDSSTVQFWDVAASKSTNSIAIHGGWPFFCNVSPRGNYVITGGGAVYGKKLTEIWKVADLRSSIQIPGFRDGLFASAISHSEDLLALAGGDYGSGGDLVLRKLEDTQESGHVSTGKFPIQDIAFSPDDSILAAASDDGAVFLYNVNRLRTVPAPLPEH